MPSKPEFYLSLKNRFGTLDEVNITDNNTSITDPSSIDMAEASSSAAPANNKNFTAANSGSPTPPHKPRIPPIVVGSQHYNQLINTLNQHQITEYTLKLTSIGIRIMLPDMDKYNLLLKVLKSPTHALRFFTHDSTDKPQKFVLKGLATQPDLTNIRSALAKISVTAADIKPMTIKNPAFPDQANYLLYFAKATTNINDLRKIKNIDNVSVTWEHYRTPKGPTQCHNCQMFGHGSRNCTLTPKCVKCSGNHRTSDCQTDVDSNNKQNLLCVNCNHKHAASYSQCPTRTDYINMRQRHAQRQQPAHKHQHQPSGTSNYHQTSANYAANFPPLQHSNSLPYNGHNSAQTFSHQVRAAPQIRPADTDPNALFSTQELLHIFQQLTTKLKACNSRTEQINVITELAINYCVMP